MTADSNELFSSNKKAGQTCPKCDAQLQIKSGSKGAFWACTSYPECDFTKPLSSHSEVLVIKTLDDVCCPECDGDLAVKSGKYGMFIGCMNYPDCNFIVKEEDDDDYEPVDCPQCAQGQLHQKSGKKGNVFYACDQYPKCNFLLNNRPVNQDCPNCGKSPMVIGKDGQAECTNKECRGSSAD